MILANFDLRFFTSIPGMLITGGVLLLLIALIIFIATGSKKENKKGVDTKSEVGVSNSTENVVNNTPATPESTDVVSGYNMTPSPAVVATESVSSVSDIKTSEESVIEKTPTEVIESTPVVVEEAFVTPEDKGNNALVENPVSIEGESLENKVINSSDDMGEEPIKIVSENSKPEDINTFTIDSNTSIDNNSLEISDTPAVTIVNEIQQSKPSEDTKQIYGGVSPVIPKIEVKSEEHRPIYGGANPLENTQSIPINNQLKEQVSSSSFSSTVNEEEKTKSDLGILLEKTVPVVNSSNPNLEKETSLSESTKNKPVEVESLF